MAIKFLNTATGITEAAGDNSTKIATTAYVDAAAGAVPIGDYLPLAGGTMTGTNGVVFPTDFKLNLGATSELQIYYNDTVESIIQASGLLYLNSPDIRFSDGGGGVVATFTKDGSNAFYYHAQKKLETTSTGVTVTGQTVSSAALISNAVDAGNPQATSNQLRLSGYGVMGNRGTVYFTNALATGSLQFGVGGAHAANTQLTLAQGTATFAGTITGQNIYGNQFVDAQDNAYYANPAMTSVMKGATFDGDVTVTTQAVGNNSTLVATTAYVDTAVAGVPVGDITGVTAGTFLTGGGTSGTVTLNADTSKLAHIVDSANASVTAGWITVAEADTARRAGEIYVTDGESGDHSFIRIDWMRSYVDSNFTVLNCGGHANRIQGVRVLQEDADPTYGPKYLQVKVTVTSNYYVIITAPGTIPNYSDFTAVTPVLEDTKTGYSVTGAQLEDLQNSSVGTDEVLQSEGLYMSMAQETLFL